MRFQTGIGYPYHRRPRGPGKRSKPGGCYRMSRRAGEARQRNLERVKRPRTPEQTERIQLEIALWTHRGGQSLRALAARLGLKSHAHCWRVARNYRAGSIEWLSPAESGLLAMRDSLDAPTPPPHVAPAEPLRRSYEGEPRAEQRRLAGAMTADEIIAEQRSFAEEWKRKNRWRCDTWRRISVPILR